MFAAAMQQLCCLVHNDSDVSVATFDAPQKLCNTSLDILTLMPAVVHQLTLSVEHNLHCIDPLWCAIQNCVRRDILLDPVCEDCTTTSGHQVIEMLGTRYE